MSYTRKLALLVVVVGLATCLGACSESGESGRTGNEGGAPAAEATQSAPGVMPGEDDSIKIDEVEWSVDEGIVDGERKVALSYTNNSSFTIMQFRIEFVQREDVTDEERAVFDEVYADSDWAPDVEASELYLVGDNQHFVESGQEADPAPCTLAYATDAPTMEQYGLMEPSVASIVYLGGDGKVYCEYYDFLNDSYSLDSNEYEQVLSKESTCSEARGRRRSWQ